MGGGLKTPIILHFADTLVLMCEEVLATNIMQNSPVFLCISVKVPGRGNLVEQQYNRIA